MDKEKFEQLLGNSTELLASAASATLLLGEKLLEKGVLTPDEYERIFGFLEDALKKFVPGLDELGK